MVTTKPQWATPERQEHLLELFVKHQNRCRQGHPACPDLRHHYQWCGVQHETPRTKRLAKRQLELEEANILSRDDPARRYDKTDPLNKGSRDPEERVRMLELKKVYEALQAEYARLSEDCPDVQHYMEHVHRAIFGDAPLTVAYQHTEKVRDGMEARVVHKAGKSLPLPAYKKHSEGAIDSWKAEDREERLFLWKLEQQHINDGTYGQYGSDFDPVARDVYYQDKQPVYFFLGFGVSAVSKQRIAIIRVPSTSMRLHIEVSQAFKGVSKNAKRQMARYGKPSGKIWEQIDTLCKEAVSAWWASRS